MTPPQGAISEVVTDKDGAHWCIIGKLRMKAYGHSNENALCKLTTKQYGFGDWNFERVPTEKDIQAFKQINAMLPEPKKIEWK